MDTITANANSIILANPIQVFNAFVDPEIMSKFWFARRDTGLKQGDSSFWYVGKKEDAYAIEVRVKELVEPNLIRIEWWGGERFTEVVWRIEQMEDNRTKLTITESGFGGTRDESVQNALDSTSGFNQVIIALKALLEHGVVINVVDDYT